MTTRKNNLTSEQERLLRGARAHIVDDPATYRQDDYGDGALRCDTPGCIAGHLVAAEPGLEEEVRRRSAAISEEMYDANGLRSDVVREIAVEALQTGAFPRLFGAQWPGRWRAAIGKSGNATELFTPTADEAVALIDAVVDGRVEDALDEAGEEQE